MDVMEFKGAKPIRGFSNIYILDKDEKIIEEVHQENCLTNRGIQMMMLNCLKNKDGFDTNCYNLSNFGTLYVMNYTQDVDDLRKLDEIRGDVIGWANADDYVASYNKKQGSIDRLSSGIDMANGEINLFFKFGYEKCNGTFNYLMWGAGHAVPDSDSNSEEGLAYTPKEFERVNMVNGNTWRTVADNRGYLYCIKSDRKVYKLNWVMGGNRKRLECATTGVALQIPSQDYIHYALFNPVTNTFWVWTNTGIYHFTLDWDFIEKKEHMQDDLITKNVTWDDTYGRRYAFSGEYVYGVYQANDTLYIDIWKYDGTKLTTQTDLFTMSNIATTIFTDTKYIYVYHNIKDDYTNKLMSVFKVNPETFQLELVCRNTRPGRSYDGRNWTYTYKRPIDHSFLVADSNGTYTYLANAIHNPGAVLKLPTTYTKGTGNMMIVHYQFKM